MNLYFSMEGINLMLPIDHDLSNTYIIFMSLEMPMNFILKTDADYFYKDSKLFSIDISSSEDIGKCVYHHFPEFIKKWNLFKGNII